MDKDSLLSQFTDITGVDAERAKFYLESSAWRLEVALAGFYENDGEAQPAGDSSPEIEEIPNVKPPDKSKSKGRSSSSRFATVSSLKETVGTSDEQDDDEEGQAFYAGGSESSGQQILGPSKKKPKDIVSVMFKSVQEHGAEVVDPKSQAHGSKGRMANFTGTGYKLGQSNDDTVVVQSPSTSRQDSQTEVTLKMWREGFSVDDGPLRRYSDPENREFLDAVRQGELPPELSRGARRGAEVHLNMEDHRHEEFVVNKFKAFSGKGQLLGSSVPTVVGSTKPVTEGERVANESAAAQSINVNEDEPSTTVQVRLADGTVLQGRFNHTHTVNDVRRYITLARPQYQLSSFALLSAFPRNELKDGSKTLAEAGVLNASLLQRLT
ncbi:NSFL1 cofactor p47 [Ischnura elegans]|uniref:NSFL1 cofactor p47 n=1 Tax=Ischnura elegans TaxID=197161 RepID=UPI001ED8A956|nr:NSFL1 cofactor p47 [Ischnura elegans]